MVRWEDKIVEVLPDGLHEGRNKFVDKDGRVVRVLVKRYYVHEPVFKDRLEAPYVRIPRVNGVDGQGNRVFRGWRLRFFRRK